MRPLCLVASFSPAAGQRGIPRGTCQGAGFPTTVQTLSASVKVGDRVMAGCDWAYQRECCHVCGEADVSDDFGPRTFMLCCGCADLGTHVECEEAILQTQLTPEFVASEDWFCSKVGLLHCCQLQTSTDGPWAKT